MSKEKPEITYYKHMLEVLGALSGLFSESNIPYLHYRVSENVFCKAFSAKNLSRSDVSADATIDKVGYGIKTFLNNNGKTFQKIAEFNKDTTFLKASSPREFVEKISILRNKRIKTTMRIYDLEEMKYHCIVREKDFMMFYECDMKLIDITNLKKILERKNVVSFNDGIAEYSFNKSKSTLYQRFITPENATKIKVKILEDPFDFLDANFKVAQEVYYKKAVTNNPYVILPLYSIKDGKKVVHLRSGLNQWNAKGRERNINEIYIPIPAWIHKRFPGFFPPRNKHFKLLLPDSTILEAKVCQQGGKALMSRHNADLGKWLLRKVLCLEKGQKINYEILEHIGLDSVIIERIDVNTFLIDFRPCGTFEKFLEKNA